jgi:hypothetical protein
VLDDSMKQNQCSDRVMNQTWRGRALGCPPVSIGGRNNHAVVVLTCTPFLGFDFNSHKNGGPQTRDR